MSYDDMSINSADYFAPEKLNRNFNWDETRFGRGIDYDRVRIGNHHIKHISWWNPAEREDPGYPDVNLDWLEFSGRGYVQKRGMSYIAPFPKNWVML